MRIQDDQRGGVGTCDQSPFVHVPGAGDGTPVNPRRRAALPVGTQSIDLQIDRCGFQRASSTVVQPVEDAGVASTRRRVQRRTSSVRGSTRLAMGRPSRSSARRGAPDPRVGDGVETVSADHDVGSGAPSKPSPAFGLRPPQARGADRRRGLPAGGGARGDRCGRAADRPRPPPRAPGPVGVPGVWWPPRRRPTPKPARPKAPVRGRERGKRQRRRRGRRRRARSPGA